MQNVIDALAALPVRGLVTTGPGLDPQELRGSERIEVVRSASHREVMRGAGLTVSRKASPERIATAVRTVLDTPRFTRAAAELGARIRDEVKHSALVTELESL